MAYFDNAEEIYKYLGGVFRAASDHPEVGPALRKANLVLRLDYSNPAATLTVKMIPTGVEVIEGETDVVPDIRMAMSADNGNLFWRGQYNVAVGLARGQVRAKGPVTKILKMVPLTKPLVPVY
ncbi:MAG: hypothetical protein WCI74_08675, partial [Actinomycetes bacterium]